MDEDIELFVADAAYGGTLLEALAGTEEDAIGLEDEATPVLLDDDKLGLLDTEAAVADEVYEAEAEAEATPVLVRDEEVEVLET